MTAGTTVRNNATRVVHYIGGTYSNRDAAVMYAIR